MTHQSMISDRYTSGQLIDEISSGFKRLGKTEKTFTIDDLGLVDESHIGGRPAFEDIIGQLNIKPVMNVLDIDWARLNIFLYDSQKSHGSRAMEQFFG